jgi:hypothetical protein
MVQYSAGVIACTWVRWLRSNLPDHPRVREATLSSPAVRSIAAARVDDAAGTGCAQLRKARLTDAISGGRSTGDTGFFRR